MNRTGKQRWTPSTMCKRPDNLMSSEYSNHQSKFIPSYEKDEVNMYWLMAHEYSRIWHQEKESIKEMVLSAVDNDFLVRRYVKRGLLLKKKEEEQKTPFKMKKFLAVPSKIKIRTKEEIDKMMSKLTEQERNELLEIAKMGGKKEAETKSYPEKGPETQNKPQDTSESNKHIEDASSPEKKT